MFNTSELYQLSFVPPSKEARTKPQIVFTTRTEYLTEIKDRLHRIEDRYSQHAKMYLSSDTSFTHPVSDLFDQVEFGYGRCGFVTAAEGMIHFRIELAGEDHLYYSALTIHILTQAFGAPFDTELLSNRFQQIDLETRCFISGPYAHAMSGCVSPALLAWLREQGKQLEESAHTLREIVKAMRQTWAAIAMPESRQWARDCSASIAPDGRFILHCFGNACDLAIYPDGMSHETSEYGASFSCHNLDIASQQLTLLAGLAKICELARVSKES